MRNVRQRDGQSTGEKAIIIGAVVGGIVLAIVAIWFHALQNSEINDRTPEAGNDR